ncbi:unnamed protein product [Caretta caretta]
MPCVRSLMHSPPVFGLAFLAAVPDPAWGGQLGDNMLASFQPGTSKHLADIRDLPQTSWEPGSVSPCKLWGRN